MCLRNRLSAFLIGTGPIISCDFLGATSVPIQTIFAFETEANPGERQAQIQGWSKGKQRLEIHHRYWEVRASTCKPIQDRSGCSMSVKVQEIAKLQERSQIPTATKTFGPGYVYRSIVSDRDEKLAFPRAQDQLSLYIPAFEHGQRQRGQRLAVVSLKFVVPGQT